MLHHHLEVNKIVEITGSKTKIMGKNNSRTTTNRHKKQQMKGQKRKSLRIIMTMYPSQLKNFHHPHQPWQKLWIARPISWKPSLEGLTMEMDKEKWPNL